MGLERSRIDAQSLTNKPIGPDKITALASKHAQHMQGVEVLCICGEDDVVERLCLTELSGLVGCDRSAKNFRHLCPRTRASIKLISAHPLRVPVSRRPSGP